MSPPRPLLPRPLRLPPPQRPVRGVGRPPGHPVGLPSWASRRWRWGHPARVSPPPPCATKRRVSVTGRATRQRNPPPKPPSPLPPRQRPAAERGAPMARALLHDNGRRLWQRPSRPPPPPFHLRVRPLPPVAAPLPGRARWRGAWPAPAARTRPTAPARGGQSTFGRGSAPVRCCGCRSRAPRPSASPAEIAAGRRPSGCVPTRSTSRGSCSTCRACEAAAVARGGGRQRRW